MGRSTYKLTGIKLIILLYVFTQVVFFDSLTLIPKFISILVIVGIVFNANKFNFKFHYLLVVIGGLSLHTLFSYALYSYLPPETLSFVNVSFFLFFFGLVCDQYLIWKYAIIGFVIGSLLNITLSVFFLESFSIGGRFEGTLGNANYCAFIINFCYLILIRFLNGKRKFITFAMLVLFAYSILVTGSKTNYFIFFLINVFFFVRKVDVKFVLKLFIIGFVGVFLFDWIIQSFQLNELTGTKRLVYTFDLLFGGGGETSQSDDVRMSTISYGLKNWSEFPIFGWGYDSFKYTSGFNLYSHSNFVELLYNTGLVGWMLYYAMYKYLYNKIKPKLINSKGEKWLYIVIGLMLIVSDFTIVFAYDKLFWILLLCFYGYLMGGR